MPWSAWLAIGLGIALNFVGFVYNYGRLTAKADATHELMIEIEKRLDRVQGDVAEIRRVVMERRIQ